MGLLFCTVFYSFDPTQVSVVMGVIFAAVMFLSMGQSSQIPTYMAEREVFYKQRGANFFRTASYVLATSVSQIPLAVVETIIFGSLVYWICGFVSEAKLFIIFELILLLSNLAMGMWFFFLSAIGRNGGLWSEIPDYLIWAHWISPMTWSLKALAINQYRSGPMDVCVYDGVDYCSEYGLKMGEYYLGLFGMDTEKEWIVYGVIYTLAMYVVFMFLSYLSLEYIRYEAPENVDVSEKTIEDEAYTMLETPKTKSGTSAVDEYIVEMDTREKNFTPVTVAFQDLHYFVPDPKNPKEQLELLKGINGFAVPGSITALMGSSGAGKTTLMDVIAGRKTGGKITGKILLNGYEANDLAIRRCTGYCEQMDVHSEAATIREALTFSSFLRQDASIPDAKNLLLLKRGGETVFYGNLGKNCRNLVDYFESIPGVAPLPKGYNPATWMLECIGAGVSSAANQIDFVDNFNKSSYRQVLESEMAKEGVTVPSPSLPEMVFARKRAATSATQMKFVVTRFFQMYWRTPTYNLTRMVLAIFLALLFGIVFVDAEYASYSGLNSGVGMVYMASLFLSMTAFQSVLPLTSSERASFYRERASQTYNAFWYFVGSTLAELPYCFVLGALFTVVFYPMVGFTDVGVAFIFWLATSLSVLMQVYMGQMFSYAMPSEEVAAIIGLLFNAIFMTFMGFSPPAYAIPSAYTWLYKISPLRFPVSILVALIFSDCDDLPTWDEATQSYTNGGSKLGCQPMADAPVTVGHITIKGYTEEYFGMKHDTITQYFFVIIGYI
ncbi:hypothetical protein PF007_g28154, partial [Phytophthora fragariae]